MAFTKTGIMCESVILSLSATSVSTMTGSSPSIANTTGSRNTAIGLNALINCTTGGGNFGTSPITAAGDNGPVFNVTTESNRVVMGHTSTSNAYIQVAWTVVSDLRDKIVLGDVPHGLDFVNKLKPIKYQFKEKRDINVAHGPVKYGFGAQDVLAIEGDAPVIVDTEVADKLKITDSHMIPVLVKAIQELKAEVDSLKSQLKGA